jgi:hypothetical protein
LFHSMAGYLDISSLTILCSFSNYMAGSFGWEGNFLRRTVLSCVAYTWPSKGNCGITGCCSLARWWRLLRSACDHWTELEQDAYWWVGVWFWSFQWVGVRKVKFCMLASGMRRRRETLSNRIQTKKFKGASLVGWGRKPAERVSGIPASF